MSQIPTSGPTTAQLKADIDRGRTGDKVAFPDPAASPLGTDDEAAGMAPSAQAIAHARAMEGGASTPRRAGDPSQEPASQRSSKPGSIVIWVIGVAIVAAALAYYLMR